MVAHHDNSAQNPDNPSNPPKDVAWGEATDEEMAHVWILFTFDDEDLNITPKSPEQVLASRKFDDEEKDEDEYEYEYESESKSVSDYKYIYEYEYEYK